MKTRNRSMLGALFLLSTVNSLLAIAYAQGSLTPPGAPAPTMKSLDQIEARTPISSAPYVITKPGSYFLTTNLNVTAGDAIDINASGVTLDLNGFTIASTAPGAAGTAIQLESGMNDLTIFNGHIRGGVTNNAGIFGGNGFLNGIYFSAYSPFGGFCSNVCVRGVSVYGCLSAGILITSAGNYNNASVIEGCTVQNVGGFGLEAGVVSRCMAYGCGNTAIGAGTAADSIGESISGDGLYALTAANCYGYGYGSGAMGVYVSTTAMNCYGYSDGSYGLLAGTAINCYGQNGGNGYGLSAQAAQNCVGSSGGGIGIYAGGIATACSGSSSSGYGLSATVANSCIGASTYSVGLVATVANSCYGTSIGSSGGIAAQIATGCYGSCGVAIGAGLTAFIGNSSYGRNTSGASEVVTNKYNMP